MAMNFPLQERYINLLTGFGFERVFGSEPNKQLLIDFLNTLLPPHHQIRTLSYKSTEGTNSKPTQQIDRLSPNKLDALGKHWAIHDG